MKNWIKAYQINEIGSGDSRPIPSGFVVSIDAIYVTPVNSADDTINLESQVSTYLDATRAVKLNNDDVPNVLKNVGTLSSVSATVDQIEIESGLFDLLVSKYGLENVELITKFAI